MQYKIEITADECNKIARVTFDDCATFEAVCESYWPRAFDGTSYETHDDGAIWDICAQTPNLAPIDEEFETRIRITDETGEELLDSDILSLFESEETAGLFAEARTLLEDGKASDGYDLMNAWTGMTLEGCFEADAFDPSRLQFDVIQWRKSKFVSLESVKYGSDEIYLDGCGSEDWASYCSRYDDGEQTDCYDHSDAESQTL